MLDINTIMLEYGTYVGEYTAIFHYGTSEAFSNSGQTELTLSDDGYCITETTYVTPPASCCTYELNETTITFQDTIIHTAEFDWTLIIDGEYNYEFDGNHLVMFQINTQQKRKYTYDLVKKE